MPRLLTLCFPTFGQANPLHLNSQGNAIVLAPDEFHVCLQRLGWHVDVVSFGTSTDLPLLRSRLPLKALTDVDFASYDVYWHMFRDPTQPEVLRMLRDLGLDYRGRPVINPVSHLQRHQKYAYAPLLASLGIGPEVMSWPPPGTATLSEQGCHICPSEGWIDSNAYNNNRGDYSDRKPDRIVTRFVDNSEAGLRSMVRAGWAFGEAVAGFRYYSRQLAFKTGGAERVEPYEVPASIQPALSQALSQLGIDVCHFDAIPVGERLYVVDVNPYPTANGTTLSVITERLAAIISQRLAAL